MIEVPTFRSRLGGGYDPAEVDAWVQELVRTANNAEAERANLQSQADAHQGRIVELEMQATQNGNPSLIDIAKHNDEIFMSLDAELRQIRSDALAKAAQIVDEARQRATATCKQADDDVAARRSHSEHDAAYKVSEAETKAKEITAAAEREAQAKADQGQAAYDEQRARMAAVSVEFERAMSERRDQNEVEHANRMKQHEAAIAQAEQSRAGIEADVARYVQAKRAEADAALSSAQAHAVSVTSQAQASADQVRRESEQELQAEMAHKNSIMTQLSTVRQMLATRLPSKYDHVPEVVGDAFYGSDDSVDAAVLAAADQAVPAEPPAAGEAPAAVVEAPAAVVAAVVGDAASPVTEVAAESAEAVAAPDVPAVTVAVEPLAEATPMPVVEVVRPVVPPVPEPPAVAAAKAQPKPKADAKSHIRRKPRVHEKAPEGDYSLLEEIMEIGRREGR